MRLWYRDEKSPCSQVSIDVNFQFIYLWILEFIFQDNETINRQINLKSELYLVQMLLQWLYNTKKFVYLCSVQNCALNAENTVTLKPRIFSHRWNFLFLFPNNLSFKLYFTVQIIQHTLGSRPHVCKLNAKYFVTMLVHQTKTNLVSFYSGEKRDLKRFTE